MAQAIFKALRDYKNQVEKHPNEKQNPDTIITRYQPEVAQNKNDQNPISILASRNAKSDSAISKPSDPNNVAYRVQFAMYPQAKPVDSKIFNEIDNVKMYFQNGSYKYTSGEFSTMDAAMQRRKELVVKGYKDAFVVAFKGNERITNEEAKRLTEKK
jgi:N-acetylmuramoyl-L-alanine amidase